MKIREHQALAPLRQDSNDSTSGLRHIASKLISVHVMELLIAAALLILLSFFHAWVDGIIPAEWDKSYGNHGPWRHYPRGRAPIDQALNILMYACVVSGLLCSIRCEKRSIFLLLVCLGCFLLAIHFLYWLVD